jgi:hypothetical protein
MLPAAAVKVLVQPIEYSPPVIVIGDAIVVPPIVTGAEVIDSLKSTPAWSTKENCVGLASPDIVVLEKVSLTPPTVRTVSVTAPPSDPDVCRTQMRAPGATLSLLAAVKVLVHSTE